MVENVTGNVLAVIDNRITGTFSVQMTNNFTLTNFWVGPGDEGFEVNVTINQTHIGDFTRILT